MNILRGSGKSQELVNVRRCTGPCRYKYSTAVYLRDTDIPALYHASTKHTQRWINQKAIM